MPYPGIPKSLTPKMERCVQKVMKTGKDKSAAIAICHTSIMSQSQLPKEKPLKTVAEKDTRYMFFSSDVFSKDEKRFNSLKEGKILKGVEVFKAGTYRGIEYKTSALDKMVANFYYLKAHDIFGHVPVRSDHPAMFSGEIIDKVGGYISELRRQGKKLVADFRITSENMWNKVMEGTYVNRSSEIGTYDDNEGNIYSPVLFGVAWVDIPQVEGLSPTFSYSKDNKNIINLNNLNVMDEEKDKFPPEEVKEEEAVEAEKVEEVEVKEEEVKEEVKEAEIVEQSKESVSFDKMFPDEFTELEKLRAEKFAKVFDDLVLEGKITPALKDKEMEFAKTLSAEQFEKYQEIKKEMPQVVKLEKEVIENEEQKKPDEVESGQSAEEKAEKFIEETK